MQYLPLLVDELANSSRILLTAVGNLTSGSEFLLIFHTPPNSLAHSTKKCWNNYYCIRYKKLVYKNVIRKHFFATDGVETKRNISTLNGQPTGTYSPPTVHRKRNDWDGNSKQKQHRHRQGTVTSKDFLSLPDADTTRSCARYTGYWLALVVAIIKSHVYAKYLPQRNRKEESHDWTKIRTYPPPPPSWRPEHRGQRPPTSNGGRGDLLANRWSWVPKGRSFSPPGVEDLSGPKFHTETTKSHSDLL